MLKSDLSTEMPISGRSYQNYCFTKLTGLQSFIAFILGYDEIKQPRFIMKQPPCFWKSNLVWESFIDWF